MATHPEPEFEQFRDVLDELARAVQVPPDVHWGRYRPLALSAGLAGLLLFFAFFAIQSGRQNGTGVDFATVEEAAIGGRLGLLEQYQVVERLDLLEEFDVIRDLDRIAGEQTG